MKKTFIKTENLYWVIIFVLLAATGCQKNIEIPATLPTVAKSTASNERNSQIAFQQVNLVSDVFLRGHSLTNAWGMAGDPRGIVWVNANKSGACFFFFPEYLQVIQPDIGGPGSSPFPVPTASPTGIVLNQSSGFNGAQLIFDGEDGIISDGSTVIDNAATASYKGLATAADGADYFIYAANFKAKTIDVYNAKWQKVNNKPFKDPAIPPDYAPFNIQNINNNLFVMYAKTLPGSINEQDGPGLGYVDIFRPDGTLLTSFTKGGVLNAPWGCAMAPASWAGKPWDGDTSKNNNGTKSHFDNVRSVVLIGNHGDGYINAFSQNGQFLGRLRATTGEAITIDGLNALLFTPATSPVNPDQLFFTAGPDHGSHGLFGYLQGLSQSPILASEGNLKADFHQFDILYDFDQMLINAWGMEWQPGVQSPFVYINANASGGFLFWTIGVYPPEWAFLGTYSTSTVTPTGIVFNQSTGFGGAGLIFDGEDGIIAGGTVIDNSSTASYKGLAIASDGGDYFIYAANFKAKTIDVYDANWQKVNNKPFKDPSIPSDYAPYNIQNINNNLFVMYAKTVPGSINEQDGPGLGYVNIFKPDGTLLQSFASGGVLNAPWGCAMAPASWTSKQWNGNANNDNVKSIILIGNHGNGHINAFNQDGKFLGTLRSGTNPITIDGLHALSFAPAAAITIDPNLLFFTSGPNNGTHGLFGYLAAQ